MSGKALALEVVWIYNPLLPITLWQPLKTRVSLGNLISTVVILAKRMDVSDGTPRRAMLSYLKSAMAK